MKEDKIILVLLLSSLFILLGWYQLFNTSTILSKLAKLLQKMYFIDKKNIKKTSLDKHILKGLSREDMQNLAKNPEEYPSIMLSQKVAGCMLISMGIITIILVLIVIF